MAREIKVFEDLDDVSSHAAAEIERIIGGSLSRAKACSIALSGGATPRKLYGLLATEYARKIDWSRVHFFWGDERFVPHDDPASNYHLVQETLLDQVPIPPGNLHPIPTELQTPEESARRYEAELRAHFGEGIPAFDLILLGVGTDGHTASLFPRSLALREREAWVVSVNEPLHPPPRLSLTLTVLNAGRVILFLVAGEEKKQIVKTILEEGGKSRATYPAAMVQGIERTIWCLDRAAAGRDL